MIRRTHVAGSADRSGATSPAVAVGGHPATVGAAVEILDAGGNAFDAVVAAGCAAAVAEPCLTSLGGGGFALLSPATQDDRVVDFFVAVPGIGADSLHDPSQLVEVSVQFRSAVQEFHVGPASVAVAGALEGYLHIHRSLGRLSLAAVVAPAIRSAREGVRVDDFGAYLIELLGPILGRTATGRDLFFHHDRLRRAGDVLTNEALGDFLADVGAGNVSGFTAEQLGGGVTAADVAAYRVVEREPLRVSFRGAELSLNPAPSFGGRLIAHALDTLGDAPRLRRGHDVASVRALAGALVSMHEHRRSLGEGTSTGTTHIGVADAEGNLASMTTSNGSGSGEFAPGLGVQLNNMMGESDLHPGGFGSLPPGERIGSMMAPMVMRHGARAITLGSGGSERIRSVLTQLVTRLVDDDVSLHEAVVAPRMHWDGAELQMESGWDPTIVEALARDWPINVWDHTDLYFGGAHLAADDGEAAGDPRRGGIAAHADPPT